jgi:hypothetical protein
MLCVGYAVTGSFQEFIIQGDGQGEERLVQKLLDNVEVVLFRTRFMVQQEVTLRMKITLSKVMTEFAMIGYVMFIKCLKKSMKC